MAQISFAPPLVPVALVVKLQQLRKRIFLDTLSKPFDFVKSPFWYDLEHYRAATIKKDIFFSFNTRFPLAAIDTLSKGVSTACPSLFPIAKPHI
jgi:hypothetical protein